MVGVVIPTYNRRALVLEAVDSVLAQEGVSFETIVVDDGSTDDTAEALESYGDLIRIIRRERGGVSAARNTGIKATKGEWIAFLDSDDLWLPGKLSAQLDFLANHPEFKICQTEEIWMRNGRRLNPKKYHKKPQGSCFAELPARCLVSPSAVVIHRDLLNEVGLFDESLPACEDYDLWLRIGLRHPMGLVEKPLVVKRGGRPDQLSSSIPSLDRYRILALAKLLRNEAMTEEQEGVVLRTLEAKLRIYTAGCQKRGKMEEAESLTAIVRDAVSGGVVSRGIHFPT